MKFVQLTRIDGSPVFINNELVEKVVPADAPHNPATTKIVQQSGFQYVREALDIVIAKLK